MNGVLMLPNNVDKMLTEGVQEDIGEVFVAMFRECYFIWAAADINLRRDLVKAPDGQGILSF